jgi:hypothetical protein
MRNQIAAIGGAGGYENSEISQRGEGKVVLDLKEVTTP